MKKKQLIGIINCTPDSYYEKGRYTDHQLAIEYGLRLVEEGADILDIGGESTRPGPTSPVSVDEEKKRILPVIQGLRNQTSCLLSVDTFKPEVAEAAIDAGIDWINDITGLSNPQMRTLVRKNPVRCCIMHMYHSPHVLSEPISSLQGVVADIQLFFRNRIQLLKDEGIHPSQIILDPGIGAGVFGKTVEQNLQIIKHLKDFHIFDLPILVGLSRKAFLQKILEKPASEVLSTTLALNTIALLEGVDYIRVHDVAEHRDILKVLEKLEAEN